MCIAQLLQQYLLSGRHGASLLPSGVVLMHTPMSSLVNPLRERYLLLATSIAAAGRPTGTAY